jgi:coiled-coil domain-containing protein 63/114
VQYEKSLETMNVIKDYLIKLLENVGVDEERINSLKDSTVSEENLMEYFGILEEKGIEIVSEYARLIAEVI